MRILSAVFCVLLILFVLVQYNDPDALLWMVIYGLASLWCGLAAFRPGVFVNPLWRGLLMASLLMSAAGVAWYWPKTPEFWRMDVWWETETAREGMGIMIVLIAMIVAWFTVRKSVANT